MVGRIDVSNAQKAYYQGDLGPAQALLLEQPEALVRLLDESELLGGAHWETHGRRRMVLSALGTVVPGAALVEVLWPIALGTRRDEREAAQQALGRAGPDVTRLIAALADGAKDTRLHAARWLSTLREPLAGPALVAAFRKEKVEVVRAALLRALVALGRPIEDFLDRDALAKDAAKTLSKGIPAALAFLRVESLPRVHWRDGRAELAPEIVHAWLVTAHRTRSPEASPLLVAYAAQLEEREREALGEAIYDRWLDEDFRLPDPLDGDVRERLEEWAEQAGLDLAAYARTPAFKRNAGSLGWIVGKTVETGALEHRGVLAVAAALAPRALVPRLVKYVRDFRGLRIGSSRAMLHMLAGMEERAATQALVRFSMRFRTASLRREAEKLVSELAARRGWSAEELADRTIPTAGLDEDGVLRLSFVAADVGGQDVASEEEGADEESAAPITRTFEARLDPHLELVLFSTDESGARSAIGKLPEPRKDEDAARASAEKKRLAASKKELKTVVAAQRDRLFSSMCSQRRITLAELREVFLSHPVMRLLLSRVILFAHDVTGPLGACRVSEDGSFVTPDNETLVLSDEGHVTIAHSALFTRADEARLAEHLGEYEIALLFPQLGRRLHVLDPAQPGLLRITPPADVVGHSLSSFVLRGRMKRLGWERGPSGDGGWADRYVRPFVGLGLEAILVHSAVSMPETDTPTSLEGIEVHRLPPADAPLHAPRSVLLTRAVPEVLRHELWNDLLDALGR